MIILVWIALSIFIGFLTWASLSVGTQKSLSALTEVWKRWPFMIALWSQVILLPGMMELVGENYQWMVFLGTFGIILTGAAPITNSFDTRVHIFGACLAAIFFSLWVILIDWRFLIPTLLCIVGGGKNTIQWRSEIGLIGSVYLTLIMNL